MMSTDNIANFIFPFNTLSDIEFKHLSFNIELNDPIYDLNQVLNSRRTQLIHSEDMESDLSSSISSFDNNSVYVTLEEIPRLQDYKNSISLVQVNCRRLKKK